jgi:DNA polymerase (family 10)
VLAHGTTRASVRLRGGLSVDLRVVPRDSFGAALVYFTGSKAHNIALRRLGQERGLKINEYGVFRGTKRIAGATEESVYRAVGLSLIPPELREDRGEIDAALASRLPALVQSGDLKGDLHAHTRLTDGRDTLEDMVAAAHALGMQYVAITEHSRHQAMSHGLDAQGLARCARSIERLNARIHGIEVLRGIEVDITADGSLALPDDVLADLDIVVASPHVSLRQPIEQATERLLRAIRNPHVDIIGHPTGRLIGERMGAEIDLDAIGRAAAATGTLLEVNSGPDRLDLDAPSVRRVLELGARIAIDSDSHHPDNLPWIRLGVITARRGWAGAKDVANTWELEQLREWIERKNAK